MGNFLNPETVTFYELIPLLEEMERNGHKSYEKVWDDYISQYRTLQNNTIFWLSFNFYSGTDKEQEYKKYFVELNKLLGLNLDNDGIMVKLAF